jgi:hypothetical protein
MNTLLLPQNVKLLYSTFINKKKERFDIILEPLQAITQLALLAFCPIGTKIAIQNNLLEIQYPGMSQSIVRWYNNDNKEDLFYLFNACRRFTLFYGVLSNIQVTTENQNQYGDEIYSENQHNSNYEDDNRSVLSHANTQHNGHSNGSRTPNDLYHLLIWCAKEGLNKLSQTYGDVDKVSLLHTLQMYKVILDNPGFFDGTGGVGGASTTNQQMPFLSLENEQIQKNDTKPSQTHNKPQSKQKQNGQTQNMKQQQQENKQQNRNIINSQNTSNTSTPIQSPLLMGLQGSQPQNPETNIDTIFIHIRNLYSPSEYHILLHTLKMLEKSEEADALKYVDGVNTMMKTTYMKIKKWINDNIVF